MFEKKGPIPPQPDPIMDRLADTVFSAQQEGVIAAGDPRLIAEHLIHCMVALPTSAAMMGSAEFDRKQAIDAYFDRTWTWLLNGISANRS